MTCLGDKKGQNMKQFTIKKLDYSYQFYSFSWEASTLYHEPLNLRSVIQNNIRSKSRCNM